MIEDFFVESEFLKVENDSKKGRSLISKKQIKEGELIFMSDCFSFGSSRIDLKVCSYCADLISNKMKKQDDMDEDEMDQSTTIICEQCNSVVYCSSDCKNEEFEIHQLICGFYCGLSQERNEKEDISILLLILKILAIKFLNSKKSNSFFHYFMQLESNSEKIEQQSNFPLFDRIIELSKMIIIDSEFLKSITLDSFFQILCRIQCNVKKKKKTKFLNYFKMKNVLFVIFGRHLKYVRVQQPLEQEFSWLVLWFNIVVFRMHTFISLWKMMLKQSQSENYVFEV